MPPPRFRGNPYQVLDVRSDASNASIKRRWRELAREHHPDRAAGDSDEAARLTARMARINAAYDLLRDPIRRSQFEVDVEALRKSSWRYNRATIFPETAIPANLRKQTHATVSCDWYVDILKTCRSCRRQYIFYALEQKHWYEELKFYVDSIECSV